MKNLKKVLALVLAFACAFTMFAGAAFTDQADISDANAEAVDLLTTLNIIKGYEDGSFQPDVTVTRAEMAKMIFTIRNDGNDDASAYETVTTSFTDISGHWAEGYIKYLQNTGIVAGKSDYIFDPDSTVTTGEAMKMALVLGGYRADKANLTGTNWLKNTVTLATTNGLTDDVSSAVAGGCTRQDAAQILSNVLGMTAVQWSEFVQGFVNDSESGLAMSGEPISVGRKWMKLWTSIGTLAEIDGKDLAIIPSASDFTDSDKDDDGNMVIAFTKIGTDYSDLLGQKVKVLFDSGKNNSVIGVFAVPANDITIAYQNELGAEDAKIKLDDVLYTLESDGVVTIVDGERQNRNWHAVDFVDGTSADVVTLVDTDENDKIDTAVVKTVEVAKVTFVSSSQIIANTAPSATTFKFTEENIDENVAKNDWVTITENLYEDCKDINVIAMANGTVKATKGNTLPASDYQIDDTWYISAADRSNINSAVKAGTEVEYIAVNGILFYAKKVAGADSKLEDVLFVALVGQDGLTNDQARVMFPNGDKATINLSDKKYDSNLDGTINAADADIVAGQFYEYSKSGNEYELSAVREYNAANDPAIAGNEVANWDHEDYYGAYTYWGSGFTRELLTSTGAAIATNTYAASVEGVAAIADSADVIVYLPLDDVTGGAYEANPDDIKGYEIKHITGKQLKNAANQMDGDLLSTDTLGVFSSAVDNLKRSTVLAVEVKNPALWNRLNNLRSTSHYALITENASDLGSTISFPVATDEYDEIITVVADENNTTNFDKGRIIGYNEIVKNDDGTYTIKGADPLTRGEVTIGSITAWNNDTIEVGVGNELDRSAFNTEVYTSTSNGTINLVADGEPNDLSDGRINILYLPDSFAFIDMNEIIGKVYADRDVDYAGIQDVNGKIDTAMIRSMQWKNASTGETWDGMNLDGIYSNALMNLSITSASAGTLTVTNAAGVTLATYEFTAANQTLSNTFRVNSNISFAWNGVVTSGTVYTNAGDLNSALAKGNAAASGAIPVGTYTAMPNTLTLKNAALTGNTTVYGNVVLDGEIVLGTNNLTVSGGTVTIKSTASVDDLSKITGSIVVERAVTAAELDKLLTHGTSVKVASISDSTTALTTASLAGKTLEVVSGDVNIDDAASDADTTVKVGGNATTNAATLNGTWDVGTLTTGTTVALNGDFTANTLAGCTALTVGGSLDVETTAPALTTLTLNAGADVTLPDSASVSRTLTVAAGSATDKTTLVARGVTVATLALNANVDVTIAKLSTSVTAGDASAKLTFTDAQAVGLALPAGTFVFQKAPTAAMTSIAAGTNLVFETGVDFKTIIPKSIATSNGATVKFTTAQPTAVEVDNAVNGSFYAADAKTTALANTQIKTGVTYELSSGSGIANDTATGWVEQTA